VNQWLNKFMDIVITPANCNIFKELMLPEPNNLKLRAELMIAVRKYVKESGLTQAEAAKVLKTTQPRLNDIIKGRIEKCTLDRLVNMLAEVGQHVEMEIVTDLTPIRATTNNLYDLD